MKRLLATTLAIAAVTTISTHALACTDFRLTAKDGTILITRSMEFATDMQSNIRSRPRGKAFTTTAADGKPGVAWISKYGYLYMDGMNIDVAIDGMNEKGLSIEALYLPGEAQYEDVPPGKSNQALPYIMFGDWVLGNFQTVDEVRHSISNLYVFTQKIPNMGDTVFPLHFAIYDATGKSIIVEYTKGKMQLYDNAIGMLTNSPTYDWQVTNLRNYLNLSPDSPLPINAAGMNFAGTGQGAGSVGLPGDASPPSRFVKTIFMKNYSVAAVDTASAINLAEHIINNVDIPIGTIRAKQQNAPDAMDYTQWVVMKDLTHKMFYYRSYKDLTLRSIAMDKVDFSDNAKPLKMPVYTPSAIPDATSQFLQGKVS